MNGTVTYDNVPIEDGQVAFEPVGAGKMQFGIISKGKYSIPQEFGLVPGEYVARITASRPTGEVAQTDAFVTADIPLGINEQFLPAKYNAGSELVVEIEAVNEVTKDFSLNSQ